MNFMFINRQKIYGIYDNIISENSGKINDRWIKNNTHSLSELGNGTMKIYISIQFDPNHV